MAFLKNKYILNKTSGPDVKFADVLYLWNTKKKKMCLPALSN